MSLLSSWDNLYVVVNNQDAGRCLLLVQALLECIRYQVIPELFMPATTSEETMELYSASL
jgi:hypothetical protein